ncbi:hypothetical protein NV379_15320 [Paenibacillus sp. N1-5-1-14]|uniref:hypothetical protein n=1 Tax=Paenibacillus radicibacter TaxID=2972488 RepID=UPI002158D3AE|nr:hypothetical protein [Paenibacillus radicibacter]MCR8644021.1 hypothetical protein [Paenibacillus radicibacter]
MSNRPSSRSLLSRVDDMRVNGWHWRLLLICALGITFENFDQISIAMTMPVIAGAWKL